MRKFWIAIAAAIVAAGLGVGIAWAASTATTGTNVACATATATTPARTVSVSGVGGLTPTIPGASKTTSHCVTQTYTVPTNTVTSPPITTTKTVTQTLTTPPPTSSTSSTSSSTSTTSSTTTQAPPPPGGAIVGVAADPKVTCAATISSGGGLDAALSAAPAGSVVCLKAGVTFGNISFDAASTKAVTLDGQGDTVGGVSIDQRISNLTLQGMNSQGFFILDPSSNITIQYSTVSHVSQGEGVLISSTGHGQSGPITGTTVRFNSFDHLGECMGDTGDQSGTTFTHNVCGPGLGFGDTQSTDAGHYIQTGGEDNMSVTHNAFIGPADPAANTSGIHLNVFHLDGTSNGVDFSNNLLWHDDAIGQAFLGQEGQFDNVTVNNNVAVEEGSGTYAFWLGATHTGTFENNTTVNSYWGNLVTISQAGQYPSSTNMTVTNNLTTGVSVAGGNDDCGYGGGVTASNNYSGDGCSGLTFNGNFQNTTWTPPTPYAAPPAGWYQPVGLSGVGYQGSVGP